MRTLHPTPALALGCALIFTACEEAMVTPPRPDSGIAGLDGGGLDPLPLEAGMTFTYRATLTYRAQAAGTEQTAQYEMVLTIGSVDDKLGTAESTLDFTATGSNLSDDDWDPTTDFDSFVARLGPADSTDSVGIGSVTAALSTVPAMPTRPPGSGKELPRPGPYFLDLRTTEALRTAFAARYAMATPQVVEPAQHPTGKFALQWRTTTERYAFNYAANTPRAIRLEYDPRGFLTRLEEDIGDVQTPPSLTCRLMLTQGP
jgi:hypothetical protein